MKLVDMIENGTYLNTDYERKLILDFMWACLMFADSVTFLFQHDL